MRALLALVLLVGCGSSHSGDDDDTSIDGGMDGDIDGNVDAQPDAPPPDGAQPDVPPDSLPDAPPPVCGDGHLDPGEACDDGRTDDGDLCDATCHLGPRCGDGEVGDDEVCDDGNHRSGDECRSDCLSDESCGNGLLDIAAGERCDDMNDVETDGCTSDCLTVASCGNGTVDSANGEQCDDTNTMDFDECGADCHIETFAVIDTMAIGGRSAGCDFSGDGEPDNLLGDALAGAGGILNGRLQDAIDAGRVLLAMGFLGLDDVPASVDPSIALAWFGALDANDDPDDNLTGSGELLVSPDAYMDGRFTTTLVGSIADHLLDAGPEEIHLSLGFFPLDLHDAHVRGTTVPEGGELARVTAGNICGVVAVSTLASAPDPTAMFIGTAPPPCDESDDPGTLADLLIGGRNVLGFIQIGPTQADVDLDGDGLEAFVTTGEPDGACQAVITSCIDGDGTVVDGRDCVNDPRFADGFSTGLEFTAVRANIVGVGD